MVTTRQQAGWRDLIAHFSEVLLTAAESRSQRDGEIPGPDGPELEWIAYERGQMHDADLAVVEQIPGQLTLDGQQVGG